MSSRAQDDADTSSVAPLLLASILGVRHEPSGSLPWCSEGSETRWRAIGRRQHTQTLPALDGFRDSGEDAISLCSPDEMSRR